MQTIELVNNWIQEADKSFENKDYKNAEYLFTKTIEV